MQPTPPCFIVIDDDPINNFICRKNIQKLFADADIQTFTDPIAGLDHIVTTYNEAEKTPTLLFVDVNMPTLSGWEVLDRFAHFPTHLKGHFSIYIFSSSIALEDKERAMENPIVKGFIRKPLTVAQIEECLLECDHC